MIPIGKSKQTVVEHLMDMLADPLCLDEMTGYQKKAVEKVIALLDGIDIDRLEAICNAERDGRCVVLPYPIGIKVYIIIRHGVLHDKILENVVCGYSRSEWQGSINKGKDSRFVICHNSYNMPSAYELRDVFLTREAAEAALAKEGVKKDGQA